MASLGDLIWPLVFRSSLAIVMVFGLIGFALGLGLILSSARTFRFMQAMNRWVSLRRAFKPAALPRDTERLAHEHRFWVGIPLVVGGIFAIFGLITRIHASAIAAIFAKGTTVPLLAIALETLRWFLIVGSVAGVVVGLMLCFSPGVLGSFEKHANRWISPRRLLRGGDQMHPTLDKLVEAHPRSSGWIFACCGLGVALYAALLLFARH